MRCILIDGSSLLSTAFFGNVPRAYYTLKTAEEKEQLLREKVLRTSSGVYTNGVYPMTRILTNLLKSQKPTHMVVAWDVSRNTFRRQLYDAYKGHRPEISSVLGEQFQTMQSVLDAMNIAQFAFEAYEADDILGTLARKFEADMPVYILTRDQDALQLISERTRVWLMTSKAESLYRDRGIGLKQIEIPSGTFEYTTVTFEEEYHLQPIQMIDKKALEGDSSDNIPGVKGVGEKVAVPLLQEFTTVEDLYNHIEHMDESAELEFKHLLKLLGIRKSPLSYLLKEDSDHLVGKQAALLSKQLATIKTDIPELQRLSTDEVRINLNITKMREKFIELEFQSLLKHMSITADTEQVS